jgi:hypothetical protein
MFFGAHLFHVRYSQGRSEELVEQVTHLAGGRVKLWLARGGGDARDDPKRP